MRIRLFYLTGCFVLTSLIQVVLYFSNRIIIQNGFTRLFPPHVLGERKTLDLELNSYYIAGIARDSIYLGNFTAPLRLVAVDTNLSMVVHKEIKIMPAIAEMMISPEVKVDAERIYLTDGRSSSYVVMPDFQSPIVYKRIQSVNTFSALVPLSETSVIFKTYDVAAGQQILTYQAVDRDTVLHRYLLHKNQDGFFSTDGMLHYNRLKKQLVYVYHYNNTITLLDTTLNIVRKGHTRDTVKTGNIEVVTMPGENQMMIKGTPLLVNRYSSIDDGYLYIYSGLMADNERKGEYDASAVIDVYSLEDLSYLYSFYVSDYEGKKVTGFRILGNSFIVVQGQHLISYDFHPFESAP